MSPTASEKVPNRALSTAELQDLLRADFQRLLDNFSLLQSCSSYSRIAWEIRLLLHTEQGDSEITTRSLPVAGNILRGEKRGTVPRPELAVVGDMPTPTPQDAVATTLIRTVDSPNAERLRAGLPVPIERRQSDSTTIVENVQYPPDESLGAGNVAIDGVPLAGAMVDAPQEDPSETAEEMLARVRREAQEIEDARLAKLKSDMDSLAESTKGTADKMAEDNARKLEELTEDSPVRTTTRYADGTVKVE
jgi:hypothetical protein